MLGRFVEVPEVVLSVPSVIVVADISLAGSDVFCKCPCVFSFIEKALLLENPIVVGKVVSEGMVWGSLAVDARLAEGVEVGAVSVVVMIEGVGADTQSPVTLSLFISHSVSTLVIRPSSHSSWALNSLELRLNSCALASLSSYSRLCHLHLKLHF